MQFLTTAGQHLAVHGHTLQATILDAAAERRHDERGEGVISMAIAVLIVAFLGVALWVAFKGFADDTGRKLDEQVDQIGS